MSEKMPVSYLTIYNEVKSTILHTRVHAYNAVNHAMVQMYWEIGRIIVEHEQGGNERSEYGKGLLRELAKRLTAEFGKGFTKTNLGIFPARSETGSTRASTPAPPFTRTWTRRGRSSSRARPRRSCGHTDSLARFFRMATPIGSDFPFS